MNNIKEEIKTFAKKMEKLTPMSQIIICAKVDALFEREELEKLKNPTGEKS